MGTRGQVLIKDTGVYLYQHYDSYELESIVKKAMSKKHRWMDVEYLTRIIFSEMIKDDVDGAVGFGIGNQEHGDIEFLITIDCENQKVIVKELINNNIREFTFEEFIE